MIDKILKVSEMPFEVREACLERGCHEDEEMTIADALAEWSAWELGDRYWGYEAANFVADMATRSKVWGNR